MEQKEAFIIVDRLDVIGGVQLTALSIARALVEEKLYNTVTISYTGTINSKFISNIIPRYIMQNIKFIPLIKLQKIPVTLKYVYLSNIKKLIDIKKKYSIIINAHGDIIPIDGDMIYFHQFNLDYHFFQNENFTNRFKITYLWTLRKRFFNSIRNRLILVNSSWTLAEAKKFWDFKNVIILHPPVMIEKYLGCELNNRKNLVITISRFSRDRQLENVLQIAKNIKDAKFVIAGYIQDSSYFIDLHKKAPSNVILLPNVSEEDKKQLLCKAKVYLNPTLYVEGFGISVVEGMAAGLIPVAVNKGGVRDTVPPDWQFNDLEQATQLVGFALDSWTPQYGSFFREKSKDFSYQSFKNKLKKLIININK